MCESSHKCPKTCSTSYPYENVESDERDRVDGGLNAALRKKGSEFSQTMRKDKFLVDTVKVLGVPLFAQMCKCKVRGSSEPPQSRRMNFSTWPFAFSRRPWCSLRNSRTWPASSSLQSPHMRIPPRHSDSTRF